MRTIGNQIAMSVALLGVGAVACWNDSSLEASERRPMRVIVHDDWSKIPLEEAVTHGLAWLIANQGTDGGWGQDGAQKNPDAVDPLNSTNDVANTAIAALALLRSGMTPTSGQYSEKLVKAVEFILAHVQNAPDEGLGITTKIGTQIQGKLGRFVDTFLGSMVLAQVDGAMPDAGSSKRVRAALEKCVDKIQKNQQRDGSWNVDGWAPVISTSLASRSLYMAQKAGLEVDRETLERVDDFTRGSLPGAGTAPDVDVEPAPVEPLPFEPRLPRPGGGRVDPGFRRGSGDAGVELYRVAQVFEQFSRTKDSRRKNKKALDAALGRLGDRQFIEGFGSMGGEEFISYMNLSDSLVRTGGKAWSKWNGGIKTRLRKLQNKDGTWAGHHCITGRTACTSAAILTLLTERTAAR